MISVLFVCRSSPYWSMPVECFDLARNALTFQGSGPVIAHPPCRGWGRYHHRAKTLPGETELALWALDLVRRNGGVLEHPRSSMLWRHLQPGDKSLTVRQSDFGHRAEKDTRLFYSRCVPPPLPPRFDGPLVPVEHLCRAERERTPRPFCEWLLSFASSI